MVSEERGTRSSLVAAVAAVASVVVLLYGLLIAQQLLLGAFLVAFIFLVYLLYRLVRGVERVARARERDAETERRGD